VGKMLLHRAKQLVLPIRAKKLKKTWLRAMREKVVFYSLDAKKILMPVFN
jgi:hypothetical protein